MSKENLFNLIRQEEVVIWAGAGLSKYAGYPSGIGLCEILLDSLTKSEKCNINENLLLPNLAEEYYRIKGSNKNSLIRLLSSVFIDKKPISTEYHDKLALIPHFKTIITTNYDRLFENSIKEKGKVILSESDIAYLDKEKVQIFKVHGDLSQPDSIIITSSDYNRFFQNNTGDNLYWTVVKERVITKCILFLGYSLEDPNIEMIFNRIVDSLNSHKRESFLVAPNLTQHKINNLIRKGIHYIDCTGEYLIDELIVNIKENIVDDLKKSKVSADTLKDFLANFNLSPKLKTINNKFNLDSIEPIRDNITGKINFTTNNEIVNKRLKELMDGESIGPIIISKDEMIDSNLSFEGILFEKDLKSIAFVPVPSNEWITNVRFANGFEFNEINVDLFRSKHITELHCKFKLAKLIFTLFLNQKENNSIEVKFDFEHNDLCGNISDEIQLFSFMCNLADGIPFTVFHNNKAIYSSSLIQMNPLLKRWRYLLDYFKKLKKIEIFYGISLSKINFNSFSRENYLKAFKIVSFIDKTFIEEKWDKGCSFNLVNANKKKLKELNEMNESGHVMFFHSKNKEIVKFYDHDLEIGYQSVYILDPYIVDFEILIDNPKSSILIKSKSNRRKILYRDTIQDAEKI